MRAVNEMWLPRVNDSVCFLLSKLFHASYHPLQVNSLLHDLFFFSGERLGSLAMMTRHQQTGEPASKFAESHGESKPCFWPAGTATISLDHVLLKYLKNHLFIMVISLDSVAICSWYIFELRIFIIVRFVCYMDRHHFIFGKKTLVCDLVDLSRQCWTSQNWVLRAGWLQLISCRVGAISFDNLWHLLEPCFLPGVQA